MVTLDESEFALQALPHAEHLARALGLEVLLIEAVLHETEYFLQAETFASAARDLAKAVQAGAEEYLAGMAKRLRDAGLAAVESRVVTVPPPEQSWRRLRGRRAASWS